MSTSNKRVAVLWSRIKQKKLLGVAVVAVLAAPLTVLPGLEQSEAITAGPAPSTAEKASDDTRYQVRCWQLGRLIFEENNLEIPASSLKVGLKLHGTGKKAVYLVETGNSTCLIKAADAPARK